MNNIERDQKINSMESNLNQINISLAEFLPKITDMHKSYVNSLLKVQKIEDAQLSCPARNRRWLPLVTVGIGIIMMLFAGVAVYQDSQREANRDSNIRMIIQEYIKPDRSGYIDIDDIIVPGEEG